MGSDGFLGRERELDRIAILLSGSARMLTLVGSGGIGKTRLAMVATARLRRAARLPVHWVPLVRVPRDASPEAVLDEIAGVVVDGDFSGRTARHALIEALARTDAVGRPLRSVLVLDNCEHVLDGAGRVIADLLAEVPGLVVLATSRTPIGWADEHIIAIPPLSRRHGASLFRQRAQLAEYSVADSEMALVEEICWHLHNYPLHIRLAAARLRYQSLPMVLRDLGGAVHDRRLRWSPGFRVGADDRHRGINTVIGWSYELCTPNERQLFARLAVFAVGYATNPDDDAPAVAQEIGADLAAIEAVCADSEIGGLARRDIESLLERLVDRSLVLVHVCAESTRYSLLESFQVFARERLREDGDSELSRLTIRHRRYYRDCVAAVAAGWVGPQEQQLLARTRAEWNNIQYAIEGSLSDPGEAVVGLEIALFLLASRIPFLRGSLRESRGLAERSLAAARASGQCPVELEVSAMALIGWLSLCQGAADQAERLLLDCVAVCVEPGAFADWRASPAADIGLPASVEYLWGGMLWLGEADPRAATVLARARVKFAAAGDEGGAAMAGLFEALSTAFHGSAEEAVAVTHRHLEATVAAGPQWAISWARFARAIALCAHGDPAAAMALCDAGLAWQIPMRDHWGQVWGFNIRAWIMCRFITDRGRSESDDQTVRWAQDIARLTGRTSMMRRRLGIDLTNLRPFDAKTSEAVALASNILGDRAFESAVREGEHASESGLYVSPESTAADRTAPDVATVSENSMVGSLMWTELTPAEREVAVLAASGLANTAIALRRGTSVRTADAQIAAILAKLMIRSRKDIAALIPAAERARVGAKVRGRAAAPR